MRLVAACFTSLLLLPPLGPISYRWDRALPWGSGAWQESWRPGRIPLAIRPVVGPDQRLWMVGGLGVWVSADGIRWRRTTAHPPWGNRFGAVTVSFRGELW